MGVVTTGVGVVTTGVGVVTTGVGVVTTGVGVVTTGVGDSGKLAARISLPERLSIVSMKPAPATVDDAPKKSKITKSSAALAMPSLLISTIRLVPCRPNPIVPGESDREIVEGPEPMSTLSVPSVS